MAFANIVPTLDEFAATFPTERVLQQALAKLLSRIPNHTGVQILQGADEIGKDLIFYTPAAFGQKDLNACVVKNIRITGNAQTTVGARTVFNQAQQALDTPVMDENGRDQRVKRVFIITPYPIPPATTASIAGALRATGDQVQFISGATLLELFKDYWPEYLAEEYKLIQSYAEALNRTTTVAKELEGLSFQYQLGAVETDIKRVYVQPRFHRTIRAYTLDPLFEAVPSEFTDRIYTQETIKRVSGALSGATEFVAHVAEWGLCDPTSSVAVRAACGDLTQALGNSWSLALRGRAATATGATAHAESFGARLPNIRDLNQLAQAATRAITDALQRLQSALGEITEHVKDSTDETGAQLTVGREHTHAMLDELARTAGSGYLREVDARQSSFTTSLIDEYRGPLFLVGPAGFGKTSFCRWNALNDLEALLHDRANTLPVYVPLHQLGRIDNKSFKNAFLRHAGLSALLPKDGQVRYDRIRVYLDGLDEVASQVTQRRIAELSEGASKDDPTIQIVITARDYVYGPWMKWAPRIQLSGFAEDQIAELVGNWLDHNDARVQTFFEQLRVASALQDMMSIPLLATLIVLVFKQTGKLPENKTRLYDIFVDLHNGGWDLAKSIQRPSRFSAAEKMFVLKRIAAKVHGAKRRELLDEDCQALAQESLKKVDWAALKSELVRDGLLTQLGSLVGFSHHSFQEFLTAKHLLGDPENYQLNAHCEEYLKGSDWWQEVLFFYTDLVAKPHETRAWLGERARIICKYSERYRPIAEQRVRLLHQHLDNSFPFAKA